MPETGHFICKLFGLDGLEQLGLHGEAVIETAQSKVFNFDGIFFDRLDLDTGLGYGFNEMAETGYFGPDLLLGQIGQVEAGEDCSETLRSLDLSGSSIAPYLAHFQAFLLLATEKCSKLQLS